MQDKLSPVGESARIISLDVLRGFGVLGILVANVQSFSMIFAAYSNPTAYGDLTGANGWVWRLTHLLVDMKFMAIFSMLFGAGILLMTQRAASGGKSPASLHYRRMGWLVVFGLLHAHLLWYGDILYWYGMCGLVVYLLRKLRPRWLLVLGLLSMGVTSGILLLGGWSMQFADPQTVAEVMRDLQPPPELGAKEVAAYQGGWLAQMEYRVPKAFEMETITFLVWAFWRVTGLMLVGMALFKWGVFSASRSRLLYGTFITAAILIGIPTVLYGIQRNFDAGWDPKYSFFFGSQHNYWASILVSLGWVGIVMLVCRHSFLESVTHRLAAVGRMAFTNYILQTVICTTLFYGHGLGLFGKVERTGQIAVVVAVWILQLIVSPIWLRHFLFGPLEWLWRSLTYAERQPFRRKPSPLRPLSD